MAKQMKQETFDDVVKENMEDMDMNLPDALEDAIEQFNSMGVSLFNIITDGSTLQSSGDSKEHIVLETLKTLEACQNESSSPALLEALAAFSKECDIDIARRLLASSNNAYNILMKLFELNVEKVAELTAVVDALCSLCNGQPDLFIIRDIRMLYEALNKDTQLTCSVLRYIRLTCVLHEDNRQLHVSHEIISVVMDTLKKNRESASVVKESCGVLKVLTQDDDVRAEVGKGHEHAKLIVSEGGALEELLNLCTKYKNDESVLVELFSTLSCLAVRDEFCREIKELGAIQLMLGILEQNTVSRALGKQTLWLVKTIAGNDGVKTDVVNAGGAAAILTFMSKFAKHAGICATGCSALAALCLRQPTHCQQVMAAGGAEVIVNSLSLHKDEVQVQKYVCMAIRNIVSRNQEFCVSFLNLDVEPLIRHAHNSSDRDCADLAKAALRDLGCKVELKCPWTGAQNTKFRATYD